MNGLQNFRNVRELLSTFNTEEKCRTYLADLRWQGKPKCTKCKNDDVYIYTDNKTFKCKSCDKQFNVMTGTIFQGTHIDLRDWFYAIYTFVNHKKGISSCQMAKDLGIGQKAAWFLLQRIRQGMRERDGKLLGDVEVDETFVGGKNKNRHAHKRVKHSQGRSLIDKAGIYGFVERGKYGRVRTVHLQKMKKKGMQYILRACVHTSSNIFSDEFKNYAGLKKIFKGHEAVNHGAGKYVVDDAHTNTIECFWSHLKRGIFGVYHWVSKHKLFRYCYEFEYRWNTKNLTDSERFTAILSNSFGCRLTWDEATCEGRWKSRP